MSKFTMMDTKNSEKCYMGVKTALFVIKYKNKIGQLY